MNVLTMIVLTVLLLFAASGWRKGMIKKLAGIVALLVSSLLVSTALPYITELLKEQTPVYSCIVAQCETVISRQMAKTVFSSSPQEQEAASVNELDRERIKAVVDQYGYLYGIDSSMVDTMSDSELQKLAGQYLQSYIGDLSETERTADQTPAADRILSMSRVEQTKLIQGLPIPDFLKNLMLNYNNSEGYRRLKVDNFAGYTVHFLADIILNIVAFIVALVAVQLLFWAVITALNLFSKLPVLHLVNRLGGLAIGGLQGLFVIWMFFLAIAMFSGTEVGSSLMDMIEESVILKPLYESNLFLKIIVRAISGIM